MTAPIAPTITRAMLTSFDMEQPLDRVSSAGHKACRPPCGGVPARRTRGRKEHSITLRLEDDALPAVHMDPEQVAFRETRLANDVRGHDHVVHEDSRRSTSGLELHGLSSLRESCNLPESVPVLAPRALDLAGLTGPLVARSTGADDESKVMMMPSPELPQSDPLAFPGADHVEVVGIVCGMVTFAILVPSGAVPRLRSACRADRAGHRSLGPPWEADMKAGGPTIHRPV